jgi:hypothetical protein
VAAGVTPRELPNNPAVAVMPNNIQKSTLAVDLTGFLKL